MNKFEKLDAEITREIAAGRNTFSTLDGRVWEHAAEVAPKSRYGAPDSGRTIDRRLQALRKRGVIAFEKGRWSLTGRSGADEKSV